MMLTSVLGLVTLCEVYIRLMYFESPWLRLSHLFSSFCLVSLHPVLPRWCHQASTLFLMAKGSQVYLTGSITLLAAAPWAATRVMLPGCPLGKKRLYQLPSVHPPLSSDSASAPIPNAPHHPAFQGVSITSCCVNLPRLLLF